MSKDSNPTMKTCVAFLRAIYHMKMERLVRPFEELGFENVDTFLASGNVIFDTQPEALPALEADIEEALADALKKDTPTFIRTMDKLTTIARHRPFNGEADKESNNLYIAFPKEKPTKAAQEKLQAHTTDIDAFHVDGQEVYWLCRTKQSESTFSGSVLERTLDEPATVRNIRTVRRIVEKYA